MGSWTLSLSFKWWQVPQLVLVSSWSTATSCYLRSFPQSQPPSFPPHDSVIDASYVSNTHVKQGELSETKEIVWGCLVPVFVIPSGVFARLSLGYMSLDKTQLNVLDISGDGLPPWGKAEGVGRETGRILSECSAANGTPGNEGEDGEEEEGKLEGGPRDEGEPEEAGA